MKALLMKIFIHTYKVKVYHRFDDTVDEFTVEASTGAWAEQLALRQYPIRQRAFKYAVAEKVK